MHDPINARLLAMKAPHCFPSHAYWHLILTCAIYCCMKICFLKYRSVFVDRNISNELRLPGCLFSTPGGPAHRLVAYLNRSGFRAEQLVSFPIWLQLALREALNQVRVDPPAECPASTYALAGRPDLAAQLRRVAETESAAALKQAMFPGAGTAVGGSMRGSSADTDTATANAWLQQPRCFDATELTAIGEQVNLAMAAAAAAGSDQPRSSEDHMQIPGLLRLLEADPALQLLFYGDLRLREAHRLVAQ